MLRAVNLVDGRTAVWLFALVGGVPTTYCKVAIGGSRFQKKFADVATGRSRGIRQMGR